MSEQELRPLLDPSALREAPVKPPLVGFIPRAGAFLIDCFLLWFVVNAMVTYAFETVYPNRMVWQAVVAVGVAVYFWLGSMAVTGGRTLGKMVLKLRVADLEGKPLGPGRALARGLMLFAIVLVWSLWRGHIWFPETRYLLALGMLAVGGVATAWTLATCIVVGQHPRKRGLHDMIVGSCVLSDQNSDVALEYLHTWDTADAQKLRNTLIATTVTVLVLMGFALQLFLPQNAGMRELYGSVDKASQVIDVDGYHVVHAVGPSPELEARINEWRARDWAKKLEQRRANLAQSGATSATLAAVDDLTTPTPGPLDITGRQVFFAIDSDVFMTSATLVAQPAYQEIRGQLFEAADHITTRPYESIIYQFVGTVPLFITGQRRGIHRDYIEVQPPDGR